MWPFCCVNISIILYLFEIFLFYQKMLRMVGYGFNYQQNVSISYQYAENYDTNWPFRKSLVPVLSTREGLARILPYDFAFKANFLRRGWSKYFRLFFPWKLWLMGSYSCWICLRPQKFALRMTSITFSTTVLGFFIAELGRKTDIRIPRWLLHINWRETSSYWA